MREGEEREGERERERERMREGERGRELKQREFGFWAFSSPLRHSTVASGKERGVCVCVCVCVCAYGRPLDLPRLQGHPSGCSWTGDEIVSGGWRIDAHLLQPVPKQLLIPKIWLAAGLMPFLLMASKR